MFVRPNIPSNIIFHNSYQDRLESVLKTSLNIDTSNKDYILFVNYPTQDINSDSDFWTGLINNLDNMKECKMSDGLALQMAKYFPEVQESELKTIPIDKSKLVTFIAVSINLSNKTITILNCYTQFNCAGYDL